MFLKLHILLIPLCVFELPTLSAKDKDKKHGLPINDWHVLCKLQPNSYVCSNSTSHSFYYDLKMQGCRTFSDGMCDLNFNSFPTLRACVDRCRDGYLILHAEEQKNLSIDVHCRLQPDFGSCNNYHPSWYFDVSTRLCKSFAYSGCGGNKNRFEDSLSCIHTCTAVASYEKKG
ncbi:tissue factor pathway inhibitor-like [Helicoverpa armigera]|uniref:tissue factor pathway inhibitor-like n=1 Tax=Helicoverpa armigera TaxID=29058 RepID=UPI0030830FED